MQILFVASQSKAADNLLQDDLNLYIEKAKNYLCQFGFCPPVNTKIQIQDSRGYLGFFHSRDNVITIAPQLESVATQLTLVHEFTHAYRHQFNAKEELWLDEGVAKFMEYKYSGVWPVSYLEKIKKNPVITISNSEIFFQPQGDGYAHAFLMMLYLHNRFGGFDFLQKIMNSKLSGWDNVITAAQELSREGKISIPIHLITKEKIIRHFAVALVCNNAFAAQYSLMFIDKSFEPIKNQVSVLDGLVDKKAARSSEKWSVSSCDPIDIKSAVEALPADQTKKPEALIQIFR